MVGGEGARAGEGRTIHPAPRAAGPPVTVIQPPGGWIGPGWRELWEGRELLAFLVWRDIKIRYKQTALGAAWAIIQPLFAMIVFSLFFGRLAGVPSGGLPYPIFAYCALVPWTYFANALALAGTSLVDHEQTITKVYFPRLFVPAAPVLAGLLDLAIALLLLVGLLIGYGIAPTAAVVALPLFVLLALATALGAGLWLAALNIEFRDVRYVVPFLIQVWLFATPVAYPASLVPGPWRAAYGLNPMVGVVEGFRWAVLGGDRIPAPLLAVSTVTASVLLLSGLLYFRRTEQTFADVV
jgi:lipopolysaccharide transport system permease protein